MKVPRFKIAWLMVAVAFAALDFVAIRAATDDAGGTNILLSTVVLPMANILAIGILIGHRHHGGRRFLVGFEVFGIATSAFITREILSGEQWVWSYLILATEPLRAAIGPASTGNWPPLRLLIGRSCLSLWATLPQLAFALIGGFLARGFKITIPPR